MNASDGTGPLAGYRVLDLTSVVMGPLATQILADLGADVIVIERADGDPNRQMGRGPHPQLSGQALNLMRGKRSVVLNIHDDRGRRALERLVAASDVFVTNLRPDSRRRARVRYEDLSLIRTDLVYCSASGFSAEDRRANNPAYDDIIQAASGMVDVNDLAGYGRVYSPQILADKVCGMAIAQAITAALLRRERTGQGSALEIAMNEIAMAFLLVEHGSDAIPEPAIGPAGNRRALASDRRPLLTVDGTVAIMLYERRQFENLMVATGRAALLGDSRFESRASRTEHLSALHEICQEIASAMTTDEFVRLCDAADVPAHRVVSLDELVESLPLIKHPVGGLYRHTPSLAAGRPSSASIGRPAPLVGQHTNEVLTELEFTESEIALMNPSS